MEDGPTAGRLRRPGWRDPRLLAGLVLIAIAVVGVATALRTADRTEPYYAAAATLVPGTVLEPSHLDVARVRVDGAPYVEVTDDPPWGAVVTRTVRAGELVPVAALGGSDGVDGRVVGVVATTPLATDVERGELVDVWVSRADGSASERIAADLVVTEVAREDGAFAVSGGATVYLAVPADQVADVLDALATSAEVAVVARGGS